MSRRRMRNTAVSPYMFGMTANAEIRLGIADLQCLNGHLAASAGLRCPAGKDFQPRYDGGSHAKWQPLIAAKITVHAHPYLG